MEPDDRNLLRLTWKGHEPSARLMWRRHAGWMVSYAGAIVGRHGPVRPEDIVQSVFLHLLSLDRTTIRAVREVRPWLACLVRHQAVNDLRSERRRTNRERSACHPTPPSTATHDEMLAALARLPRRHREVLHLRVAVGLTVDQTAEALGVPRGTIASRQHAATHALRTMLLPTSAR